MENKMTKIERTSFNENWEQLISEDTMTTFLRSDGTRVTVYWDEEQDVFSSNSFGGYSRNGTQVYGRANAKTLDAIVDGR